MGCSYTFLSVKNYVKEDTTKQNILSQSSVGHCDLNEQCYTYGCSLMFKEELASLLTDSF